MKNKAINQAPTMLLRAAVVVLGLIIFMACAYPIPAAILNNDTERYYLPILWGLYVPAIPFFYALWQSMQILNHIDKNNAFSAGTVVALKRIKRCAVIISSLFTLGLPYIYYAADRDDAPGTIVIALVIISASFVIAAAGGVLQRMIQHGVNLTEENELTV